MTLELNNRLNTIECLLKNNAISNKEVLTIDDVVQLTGISKSYLYKLTSKGKIPHYKPSGKKLFFKRNEVEEWLTQNRVKPENEIENEAANLITNSRRSIL